MAAVSTPRASYSAFRKATAAWPLMFSPAESYCSATLAAISSRCSRGMAPRREKRSPDRAASAPAAFSGAAGSWARRAFRESGSLESVSMLPTAAKARVKAAERVSRSGAESLPVRVQREPSWR